MRVEENKVYVFTFNTGEHGDLSIPVRGESHEVAAHKLQEMFARMQTELAMEFPKTVKASGVPAGTERPELPENAADGLSDILIERIDSLLAGLGGEELVGDAKAKTIENWTELKFTPDNYAKIVHELELIASGAKVIPSPTSKPKKK